MMEIFNKETRCHSDSKKFADVSICACGEGTLWSSTYDMVLTLVCPRNCQPGVFASRVGNILTKNMLSRRLRVQGVSSPKNLLKIPICVFFFHHATLSSLLSPPLPCSCSCSWCGELAIPRCIETVRLMDSPHFS